MDSIHIKGGVALQGKVRIQGSKNAALPVLAATLLTKEVSYIRNCPRIADVYLMISLLGSLGCNVSWEDGGIRVDAGNVCEGEMPAEAIKGMRSSLCLLGAMLARCGEIVMEHPGGCIIGERPIDIHLAALTRMGVSFKEEEGRLYAKAEKLKGAEITLPFASVGATENILLAAVAAEGNTIIKGAAREPEITALCRYLQCCGAQIEGIDTDSLIVHGGISLHGGDFYIPPDRIVAGTYLFGCIATGGTVLLEEAPVQQMEAAVKLAEQMGSKCEDTREGLFVQSPKRPILPRLVRTAPYPEFPTDLQSMALVAMTIGEGECIIEETIFENRFRVVEPLKSMGANIKELDSKRALIKGVDGLTGRTVEAMELRGGAALVLAGLVAQGRTKVTGCSYIYRGYENICRDLRELGARVIIG